MKITKSQLKRIIKEERAKLAEYGEGGTYPADRAMGSYFDTALTDQFRKVTVDLYENAMEAALGDLGVVQDAHDAVTQGLRKALYQSWNRVRQD